MVPVQHFRDVLFFAEQGGGRHGHLIQEKAERSIQVFSIQYSVKMN
jgi:hypothetical protein